MTAERLSRLTSERVMTRLAETRLARFAKRRLPERAEIMLRQIFLGQRVDYPIKEPVSVKLGDQSAKFWVRNRSDWNRLIAPNSFEQGYGQRLIATLEHPQLSFVDIGAAQGIYTIMAAMAGCQVWAVDPDPVSLKSLEANLLLNSRIAKQVRIVNTALGNRVENATLHFDLGGRHAPSMAKTVAGLKDTIAVKVTTLDQLITDGAIPAPDVVKIDVEGAELAVIQGMQKTLSAKDKPKHVFVEIHPPYLPLFGATVDQVLSALTCHGYLCGDNDRWPRRDELLCHFQLQN